MVSLLPFSVITLPKESIMLTIIAISCFFPVLELYIHGITLYISRAWLLSCNTMSMRFTHVAA